MISDERIAKLEKDISRGEKYESSTNLQVYDASLKVSVAREMIDEIKRLRAALSLIAELIPEYASEAWIVQTAKDALGGVKSADG